MKLFRRYLSVLLCLVVLFAVFSVNVSASEQIENKPYNIYATSHLKTATGNTLVAETMIYPGNEATEVVRWQKEYEYAVFNSMTVITLSNTYYFANNDNSALLLTGNTYTVNLSKLYENVDWFAWDANSNEIAHKSLVSFSPIVNMRMYGESGKYYDVASESYTVNGKMLNVTGDFTPVENIVKIVLVVNYDIRTHVWRYVSNFSLLTLDGGLGEQYGNEYVLNIAQSDKSEELLEEQNGLIAQILGWLSDLFDAIIELPSKLWEKIETGLKTLFIPSDDAMDEISAGFKDILETRFGAVYEVAMLIPEMWESMQLSAETQTIDIPTVTIPVGSNETFTFGGNAVRVVPTGFDEIANACKYVTSMIATIAFFNGMRRRYDEVLEG